MVFDVCIWQVFSMSAVSFLSLIPSWLFFLFLYYSCAFFSNTPLRIKHHARIVVVPLVVFFPVFLFQVTGRTEFEIQYFFLSGLMAFICLFRLIAKVAHVNKNIRINIPSLFLPGGLLLFYLHWQFFKVKAVFPLSRLLPVILTFFIIMYVFDFFHNIFIRPDGDFTHGNKNGKVKNKVVDEYVSEAKERESYFMQFVHEIKTPLMLISSYLDQYSRNNLHDKDLDIIKKSIHLLQSDILNYLDFMQHNSDYCLLRHDRRISLSELISEKENGFQIVAESRNIRLESRIQDRVFMTVDPVAIDRIINNLLDNALKYTNRGGRVGMMLTSTSGTIMISVSDTGEGIPPDKIKRISDPFYHCKDTTSTLSGSGLGMHIVLTVVQSLGGSMVIRSRDSHSLVDDQWSTVVEVKLPEVANGSRESNPGTTPFSLYAYQEEARVKNDNISVLPNPMSMEDAFRPLVLVVDADKSIRTLIDSELGGRYIIETKENGLDALKWLESGNRPDIIVSDIIMDVMDGYTLFRELKRHPELRNIPFIYLTGISSQAERMRGLAEGAIDFISKPLRDVRELDYRITSLLQMMKEREKYIKRNLLKRISDVVEGEISLDDNVSNATTETKQRYGLTDKETTIIEFLRKGLQNKEIGRELSVSSRTIDNHLYKIYRKTGCQNRTELLNKVYR